MKPLISIVIPVYNSEEFLEDTLNSIKNQTYKYFEVICVDDGSTDNSLNIIKRFADSDKRFNYYQQQNQYAGIARNSGMDIAKGKYILFLDSDDLFEKNMLSVLVASAEKYNTDIVLFGFYHFKEDLKHRSLMGIPFHSKKIYEPQELDGSIFQICQGVPWNKFYNRKFVISTGLKFQDLQSNNDVFFSKMIVTEAKRLYFLNRHLVNYRISNNTSLQGSYKLSSGNYAKCILAIYNELNARGSYELYKKSFIKYVLDSYMLIFNKCENIEGFRIVCSYVQDSLNKMSISQQTEPLFKHPANKVFENIIDNHFEKASFEVNMYYRRNFVNKIAIEYRIGKRILSILHIKNYD